MSPRLTRLVVIAVALMGTARFARAQGAWVGDPGSLTGSLSYHYVPSSAVIINPDTSQPDRPTQNHIITLGAEYVPIENLAIEAQVPLALVKYAGSFPHIPPGAWDDGNYHTTLTDFRAGVRYQLLDEPYVALSPYAAFTIPMANYEVNGFATGGRHLKQAHFGASIGRTLSPVLPNLFVMGGYEFTFSERYNLNDQTKQFTQNRSDFDGELGYAFLDGALTVAAAVNYRFQHGGIEFDDFGFLPPELTLNHDPVLKEEYVFVGGNVGYAINTKLSISAAVRFFLTGWNTRDQSLYGLEVSYRAL